MKAGQNGRNYNGLRYCNLCHEDKPLEDFGIVSTSSDGLNVRCKSCVNEKNNEYKQLHPEKVRESARQYWQKHKEERLAYNRQYIKEHPEVNRLNSRMQRRKRTTLKRGLVADFSLVEWHNCLDYWQHKCAVCERPIGFWHTLSQDHWTPLSKGGGYTVGNIVPLCHGEGGCNNSKSNRDANEWLVKRYGARKAKQILGRIERYFDTVRQHED